MQSVLTAGICAPCEVGLRMAERSGWTDRKAAVPGGCDLCRDPLLAESWVIESQPARRDRAVERSAHLNDLSQLRVCFACLDRLYRHVAGISAEFDAAWAHQLAEHQTEPEVRVIREDLACTLLGSCPAAVPLTVDVGAINGSQTDEQVAQRALQVFARRWLKGDVDTGVAMQRVAVHLPGREQELEICLGRSTCPRCGTRSIISRGVAPRESLWLNDLWEALPLPAACIGPKGEVTRVNRAWTETIGEWIASGPGGVAALLGAGAAGVLLSGLEAAAASHRAQRTEPLALRALGGGWRRFEWNLAPTSDPQQLFAVLYDVTEDWEGRQQLEELAEALRASSVVLEEQAAALDEAQARATYAATHDYLTGILNRRAWFERATSAQLRAVAVIDIDRFKTINDRYGHPAGDAVLAHVATTLQAAVGAIGVAGRIGGEEFAVAFSAPARVARRALAMLQGRWRREEITLPSGERLRLTASVGLAAVSVGAGSASAALESAYGRADGGLYRAKATGRDRLVAWEEPVAAAA